MNHKNISESEFRKWRAKREFDFERQADDLLPQVIGPEKQNIDLLIKTVEVLKELKRVKHLTLDTMVERDFISIIQRRMKAKALGDIRKAPK